MLASLVSVALLAATARAQGQAIVVNKCSYDVTLAAVPASGGGYSESQESLASGQSWSQDWTQLSNGAGWSIKLSQTSSLENILQYEYTWQNDGTIWYDLSCVNGNPWDGNWEITSTGDCSPRQAAYMYATDDAFGMQSCPAGSSITVTLCSGDAADSGSDSTSQSSAAPVVASTSEEAAPVKTSIPAEVPSAPAAAVTPIGYNWNNADVSKSLAPVPTTLATLVHAAAVGANGNIVNVVETVWVTDTVTQYAKPKRHEHHPHHRGSN